MRRLAIHAINHQHALALHHLIKPPKRKITFHGECDLKLKPDFNSMRIILLQTASCILEHADIIL